MKEIPYLTYKFDGAINIYPVFDPHYGSVAHCEEEFRKYLNLILEDPVGYCVLGGDLINNNIPMSVGLPREDLISPLQQKYDMVDMLRPLAESGRILTSVRGNHEFRTTKSSYQDVSYDIMSKLDLTERYAFDRAILQIQIGTRKHGAKFSTTPGITYYVLVVHGNGGGKKPGSTLNNVDDLIKGYGGLDVCFSGHTHKPMHEFAAQTVLNTKGYYDKSCCVVVASSWVRNTDQGYALRKGLPPVDTCQGQCVTLNPSRKYKEYVPDIGFSSFHF